MGRVVRVAAVSVHRYDRKIVGNEILPAEGLQNPLLYFIFVSPAVSRPPANLLESRSGDGIDGIARREVRLDLLGAQSRFKLRHQVAGTDHVLPQAANQIDGAAIHE